MRVKLVPGAGYIALFHSGLAISHISVVVRLYRIPTFVAVVDLCSPETKSGLTCTVLGPTHQIKQCSFSLKILMIMLH